MAIKDAAASLKATPGGLHASTFNNNSISLTNGSAVRSDLLQPEVRHHGG